MAKKKMSQAVTIVLILAVAGVLGYGMMTGQLAQIFSTAPEPGTTDQPQVHREVGQAATLYINAYDREADALTEVSPTYTIFKNGIMHLDNTAANSSTGWVVGDKASIYDTGTSYYSDPIIDFDISNEAPTVNIDSHAVVTVATVDMKAYDTSLNELSAGPNDTDYNMTLGAAQEKAFYVKIDTAQANKNLRIKAFCTFGSNQTDGADLKVVTGKDTVEADWTKVTMPKQVSSQTLSIKDNSGAVSLDYDACYEYRTGTEEFIDLHEWEEYWMKWTIEAGTGDPVWDLNSIFGMIWVDYDYSKGKDNIVYHDFYKHDDTEYVTTVGVTETLSSPMGLDNGICFEAI